jgi:hypothetical protein
MSCPIFVGRLIVIDGGSVIVNIFSLADTSTNVYFCKENLLMGPPVPFFHVNALQETFDLAYDVLTKQMSIVTDRGQISVTGALAGSPKVVVYPFQIEFSQTDIAGPPSYTLYSPFAYSRPNWLRTKGVGLQLFGVNDFVNFNAQLLDRQSFQIKGVGAFQIQFHEMEHVPLPNQPAKRAPALPTSIARICTNPFAGTTTLRKIARKSLGPRKVPNVVPDRGVPDPDLGHIAACDTRKRKRNEPLAKRNPTIASLLQWFQSNKIFVFFHMPKFESQCANLQNKIAFGIAIGDCIWDL